MDKSNICETVVYIPAEVLDEFNSKCSECAPEKGSTLSWVPEFILHIYNNYRTKQQALNVVEKIV